MGKEDTAMKAYMSQNRVFADIFTCIRESR